MGWRFTRRMCTPAAVLLAMFAPTFALAATPPPVAAFGDVPALDAMVLSPSGTRLAWSDTSGPQARVQIFDIAKRATIHAFGIPDDLKPRDLEWTDDETLLVTVSKLRTLRGSRLYRDETFRTFAVDAQGGPARVMLFAGGSRAYLSGAEIVRARVREPKTVVMAAMDYSDVAAKPTIGTRLAGGRKDSGWSYSLFAVSTITGAAKLLERGTPYTYDWLVDDSGSPVARSEWNPASSEYRLMGRSGGGWRELQFRKGANALTPLAFDSQTNSVLATAADSGGRVTLLSIPLDGSPPSEVPALVAKDVSEPLIDSVTQRLVGVTVGGPNNDKFWLDDQFGNRAKSLVKAFPNRRVHVVGRSLDFSRFVARVSAPSAAPIYYFVDFSAKRADIVGEAYPALTDVPLATTEAMTYLARDNYQLTAYLTTPVAMSPKELPLVVMPHGGPESRDYPDFDWWVQFLASRGYAVLQPQFRGSTGFGEAHRLAGFRQWGRVMQDDVTDGVKALIARGIADRSKICIMGASYGGYAALAGAAYTPELYACAASISGVADLPEMLGFAQREYGAESSALEYWTRHIGSKFDSSVAAVSPARSAKSFRAPVLLMHGVDDTVVPIAQSKLMAQALQDEGKPVKFVTLNGEDHWLSRSETRKQMLAEIEMFLAKHLRAE
jgi:dipeptidyl aminopeptidase/acylaminoacyl peptidase